MNSRQKGARGERGAAAAWQEIMGGPARRGQQFSGGTESPDIVIAHKTIHVEVKRTERGNPYQWLEQAARDAGGKVPVVLHRRNRKPWIVLMELTNAPRFILAAQEFAENDPVGKAEVPADHAGTGVPPAGEA